MISRAVAVFAGVVLTVASADVLTSRPIADVTIADVAVAVGGAAVTVVVVLAAVFAVFAVGGAAAAVILGGAAAAVMAVVAVGRAASSVDGGDLLRVVRAFVAGSRDRLKSCFSSGIRWLRDSFRRRSRAAVASGRGHRLRIHETVDYLVDYLVERAVRRLPEGARDRFAEEWLDHRSHLQGWRLLWWALCVRATAALTASELEHARLPRAEL